MARIFTYKTFFTEKEALEFAALLKENHIKSRVDTVGVSTVSEIAGEQLIQYALQIAEVDRIKVDNLFIIPKNFEIDPEHPFNKYDNSELIDVVGNRDEWNVNEINIADFLLQKRGVKVSKQQIETFNEQRLDMLKQTKSGDLIFQIFGFAGSIIGLYAFLGFGLISSLIYVASLSIGINYYFNQKKLPNGGTIYVYNNKTRNIGLVIICFNIMCIIGGVLQYILRS